MCTGATSGPIITVLLTETMSGLHVCLQMCGICIDCVRYMFGITSRGISSNTRKFPNIGNVSKSCTCILECAYMFSHVHTSSLMCQSHLPDDQEVPHDDFPELPPSRTGSYYTRADLPLFAKVRSSRGQQRLLHDQ